MPLEIDEAWEYWEPDPEIDELLDHEVCGFDSILGGLHDSKKSPSTGFRFGSGSPDRFVGGGRPDDAPVIREGLPPVTCVCGIIFQPKASRTRYCSRKCQPRYGPPRVLPDATCPHCGVLFRRKWRGEKFCKRACADKRKKRG